MISTVTTSTVSTVTIAGSIALVGVFVLFAMLLQKELASSADNQRATRLSKILNIAIVPLLIAFFLFVISKVADVLR